VRTKEYETPFAKLHVYKNGHAIDFEIQPFEYGMYLNDDSYKKPEGLYKVTVDMNSLQLGDVLVCEFDCGCLHNDGGNEYTLNIVGSIDNYTVGMGTYDTQDINECFGGSKPWIPYDVWGDTGRGYEIHIIDNPKEYQSRKHFQQIYFIIAWEPKITDEARELISFVTC
jgi:hypothetical protein